MDLKQRKLTKSEWDSIEIPVSKSEQDILKLITDGFTNINIKVNNMDSIFTNLKIEYNSQIEEFLYVKFFADKIKTLVETYNIPFIQFGAKKSNKTDVESEHIYYINVASIVKLRSTDQIRLSRLDSDNILNDSSMYETILFKNLEQMVKLKHSDNKKWMKHYYTLKRLLKNSVEKVNTFIKDIVNTFLQNYESDIDLLYIVENSWDIIEKNQNLLKYSDLTLYEHQKHIYNAIKSDNPKLILYITPTGTGKTLTPLGLSEKYKIIFVCAARHVGLALARSAISIGKKIGFAFGCSSAEDVRLHYFAAKEFTKDKRSGQIRKVDNTIGDKVEILICDIRSYLPAMYYMNSFNDTNDIVTFWDEPTITLDYDNHDLHKVIKKNWKENIIPNVVLSSATLPKLNELTQTIADFKNKFEDSEIINILSHDCKKTIPLINNNGYVVMPHHLSSDYNKIKEIVEHCEENLTLLRYFDLKEASEFICYVEQHNYNKASSKFDRSFATIDDIDMKSIKIHYLKVLKSLKPEQWHTIYNYFAVSRTKRIKQNNTIDTKGNSIVKTHSLTSSSSRTSGLPITRTSSVSNVITTEEPIGSCGIYVTTKDAYTLTDGPTIFLANDLQKVAKFCIQQANIPAVVMKDIIDKIEYNNKINQKINESQSMLELEEAKLLQKLMASSNDNSKEAKKLQGKKNGKNKMKIATKIIDKTEDRKIADLRENIATLRSMAKNTTLDDIFIPNKLAHLNKWAHGLETSNSFTSDIDEDTIVSIMLLNDVDDSWKILLLLGIGVFANHRSTNYTEIMKNLADKQKLYLIIADSDYIYGTNYQMCHGYLSKDLDLTQDKIIQALGRIGRNNIQQEYSARFRDDAHLYTLFAKMVPEDKPEVVNMNQLFNSKNVKWNGVDYEEFPDEVLVVSFEDDDDEDDDVVAINNNKIQVSIDTIIEDVEDN